MKKTISYLAVVSSLVLAVNLAHAEGEACDENMHKQLHGHTGVMDFSSMDANHDGVITKAEFNRYNAAQFKALDSNKDGKLVARELPGAQPAAMGHSGGTTHLDQRFYAADANHDGGLDRTEANDMPMLSRYFDEVDSNKDGKVTRQEYFDAMPLLHGAKQIDTNGKSQAM